MNKLSYLLTVPAIMLANSSELGATAVGTPSHSWPIESSTSLSSVTAGIFSQDPVENADPDQLTLKSGSVLTGSFVRVVDGAVVFNDKVLGDVKIDLKDIALLTVENPVAVVGNGDKLSKKTPLSSVRSGRLKVENGIVTITTDTDGAASMGISDVKYIVDRETLESEIAGSPGLLKAWKGSVTAGASIVQSAQDAHNYDGSLLLVRRVPTVSWLAPRNRTSLFLNGASGKINQPSYTNSGGTIVPEQVTKTNVLHAKLQRDQYFSSRAYYFGTAQFDHNYSQNLQLQQLYGAGLGYTVIDMPRQTLDFTANVQYVRQSFMNAQPGDNKDLVGSTLSANYTAKLSDGITFNQYVAYLPAFNDADAYSVIARNSLSLPAYKGFRVVLGSVNSYLNSVSISEPPSKRNSFQFTFGVGYDI